MVSGMTMVMSLPTAKGITLTTPRDSLLVKPNLLSSLSSLDSYQVYLESMFVNISPKLLIEFFFENFFD